MTDPRQEQIPPLPAPDAAPPAEEPQAPLPEGMATAEQIREALREVIDPEIGLNIVDLGLIYEVLPRADGNVDVNMTLTSPGCPMGPEITSAVWMTVKRQPGVQECDVKLVWKPRWDPTVHASEDAKAYLGIW
ncbi:MAG: metal-sulfur cluster assembly factor [Candidatus Eremiobacterota bacterium]